MSKKRYGTKSDRNIFQWIYFALFGLITVWLLSSIFFQKSPVALLKSISSKTKQIIPESTIVPYDSLVIRLNRKEQELSAITKKLEICKGEKNFKKALIDIESNNVNMRAKPSLSSDIVLKIPDSSVVQIQYYDTEKFILDGKYGRWCRIIYANEEGWVWGNFLKELEE